MLGEVATPQADPQLASPGPGRRFVASRPVRIGDVLPSGQVRLDALARYLQDVATDDGVDARIDPDLAWIVRKTVFVIDRRPSIGDQLELTTWASASGGRWAERRTTITVAEQPVVEAAATWVCVDRTTGRPARLSERFWEMYGEAVGTRTVSSRLTHRDPPEEADLHTRPWPLRVSDVDVFDHVNNAAVWVAVEHTLHEHEIIGRESWAEVEFRDPIGLDADLTIASLLSDSSVAIWLLGTGTRLPASAVVGLNS